MSGTDFCEHDSFPDTCGACNGRKATTPKSATRGGGPAGVLDSPAALEKYRKRYLPDRESTFEAYVDVFFRLSDARSFPGGWTMFSRCANAEGALVENEADLVARAEELMRVAGYACDDSGRPKRGRTWRRASEVTSSIE